MAKNKIEIVDGSGETITLEDFVAVEVEDGCLSVAMPSADGQEQTHYWPLGNINKFTVTEEE